MTKKAIKSKSADIKTIDKGQKSSSNTEPAHKIIVHAQYIKDLSFENPNAPHVLIDGPSQPDVEITVSVGAQMINENQYEVILNLAAKATADDKTLFLVDLAYAGIVSPEDVKPADVNPVIMIEAPRLLFPFARAIVSEATRDGGFMPLNIQPVDFVAVYQHNLAQQASTQPRN